MKQRYLRVGDELPDDESVVVRGGEHRASSGRTALRNHAVYGSYGISVFAVRDLTLDELAQQPPLVR